MRLVSAARILTMKCASRARWAPFLAQLFVGMALAAFVISCAETREERFATYGDAIAGGASRRGILPAFVPASAFDLVLLYDIDTGGVRAKFRLPADDLSVLVSGLQALNEAPPPPKSSRPGRPGEWPSEWKDEIRFLQYIDGHAWYVAIDAPSGTAYAWTRDA